MTHPAVAIALFAAVIAAGVLAAWANPSPPAPFHQMRYCAGPGGTFPTLPCATREDPNEVIQS